MGRRKFVGIRFSLSSFGGVIIVVFFWSWYFVYYINGVILYRRLFILIFEVFF